jgi:HTH-type transcriptional regulator / antitoxin HigA
MSGKMIPTFDAQSYTELLIRYQPKPITTEVENDRAITLAQELEHRSPRTVEESVFLELLVTLIEKFEAEQYPISVGNPVSMLRHLMDARDLDEHHLVEVFGNQEKVADVLARKINITVDDASKLAKLFRVEADLFLEFEQVNGA